MDTTTIKYKKLDKNNFLGAEYIMGELPHLGK